MIKDRIKNFLNDPGLALSRANKENIVLEDIFVFPELKQANQGVINSKKLLEIREEKTRVLISGTEDSGKTTLIKVLIKHYLTSGYFPVYIDAQNIELNHPSELPAIIDSSYEDMYKPDGLEIIRSSSKKNKAIFIDNFEKANERVSILSEILEYLYKNIDKLVFSIETDSKLFDDSEFNSLHAIFSEETTQYETIEFSKTLQLELIEKWHKTTERNQAEKEIPSSKIEHTKAIIDTVIESKLVPATPLFLLTILQSDIEDETKLISDSSYGYYYEHIALKPIRDFTDNRQLDFYLEFLSELSYFIFDQNKKFVSYKELNNVYSELLDYREDKQSFDLIINNLINSETLRKETLYSFKHKYSYQYFVARYLSENIEQQSVQDKIKDVFSGLYNDDNAHIILFLTHLNDDTMIINELLSSTKSIFSDEALTSKHEDSTEIEELIEELSRLASRDRNLKEAPTQYKTSRIDMINSYLITESSIYSDPTQKFENRLNNRRLKAAKNLLKIVKEFLKHRRNNNKYTT